MTTKETGIKLTLSGSGFRSGMRGMVSVVQSAGRAMGKALKQPMNEGIKSAKREMSSMTDELKTGLKTAATLGGAVSFGAMIKSAVDAQDMYISLAHRISDYSGRVVHASEVQKMMASVADKTGARMDELRMTMDNIAATPGGMSKIPEVLERAYMQSKRLGGSSDILDKVGRSYNRLMTKGLADSGKEVEILLEKINHLGRVIVGMDPDEAIDPMDVSEYASFVNRLNSNLNETFGLLKMTGSQVKDMGQHWMFLEQLGTVFTTTEGINKLRKELNLSKKDVNMTKGAIENLVVTLEKSGMKKFGKLQAELSTEEAQRSLQDIVGKELIAKIESGKATKKEWDLRINEIRSEIENAKKAVFDYSKIVETDNKIRNTASANFNRALNTMTKGFNRPEIIESINELAENLPEFAKKISDFIGWVVKNPGSAASAYVLGRIGLSFTTAAVESAAAAGVKKLFAVMIAQQAASKAAGGIVALGVKGALAASSLAALAGAAGAGAGYFGFKKAIDPEMSSSFKKLVGAQDTLMDTSRALKTSDINIKKRALSDIKGRISEMKEGPDIFTKMTGSVVSVFSDEKSVSEKYKKSLTDLQSAQSKLIESIKSMSNAADTAGTNLKKVGEAAKNPATRGSKTDLNKYPGATGKRG